MDEFIKKHISIVNKNNNLIIYIGNSSYNTFDTKISKKEISNFITKLYNKYPHIKKFKVNKNKKIYKNKNIIIETCNKSYECYSYTVTNSKTFSFNTRDVKMNIIKKEHQDECNPSCFDYNYIENIENIKIDIQNIFNIVITNIHYDSESWFKLAIEIKKPNDPEKLYLKIKSILEML